MSEIHSLVLASALSLSTGCAGDEICDLNPEQHMDFSTDSWGVQGVSTYDNRGSILEGYAHWAESPNVHAVGSNKFKEVGKERVDTLNRMRKTLNVPLMVFDDSDKYKDLQVSYDTTATDLAYSIDSGDILLIEQDSRELDESSNPPYFVNVGVTTNIRESCDSTNIASVGIVVSPSAENLAQTIGHELGHAQGLAHALESRYLMAPISYEGVTSTDPDIDAEGIGLYCAHYYAEDPETCIDETFTRSDGSQINPIEYWE